MKRTEINRASGDNRAYRDMLMRLRRRVRMSDVHIDFVCMGELETGIDDYLCAVLILFMTLIQLMRSLRAEGKSGNEKA